jgi:hypothetical protein
MAWWSAGLPQHVNRDTAAQVPVASNSEPARLEQTHQPTPDPNRAIFMEGPVIAEGRQIELEGF